VGELNRLVRRIISLLRIKGGRRTSTRMLKLALQDENLFISLCFYF